MGWRAAGSLLVWHAQMKAIAPRAVRELPASVWGLKAGGSHPQSGGHWPHVVPGLGNEIVTAADAPDVPDLGLNLHAELECIRRSRDPRVLYAISRDRMFSSYRAHGFEPFTWRPYNAADPSRDRHMTHGHLQVVDAVIADDRRPWATTEEDDMTPDQAMALKRLDDRVTALLYNQATNEQKPGGQYGEQNGLHNALRSIADGIADLKATILAAPAATLPAAGYTLDEIAGAVADELHRRTQS